MNILMMTNTYLPHVGGVAHAVHSLSQDLRDMGHRVVILAPEFGQSAPLPDVIRLKAWQRFNGSEFSLIQPFQGSLVQRLNGFSPQIIHSHHPFLMGQKALQLAQYFNVPLVFTYHTLYQHYTHYLPLHSPWLQAFASGLANQYASLCQAVIAPSASLARTLAPTLASPVQAIATGIVPSRFSQGSGWGLRRCLNLPAKAFVVGHIGRLAQEKNLHFLAQCLSQFVQKTPQAYALIAGQGPLAATFEQAFQQARISHRLRLLGTLTGPLLVSAYKAMDVFAFSSLSETQGLVILEAQAAGVPVVALRCPVLEEVITQGHNGSLVPPDEPQAFVAALDAFAHMPLKARQDYQKAALACAAGYHQRRFSQAALALYQRLCQAPQAQHPRYYWPCLLKAAWQASVQAPLQTRSPVWAPP